jgi:tripartite-type tricarboxylate transporter receptor subunit TctC
LFAPAKTPAAIVDRINRATLEALRAPTLREKLAGLGVDPMAMSAAEFKRYVEHETGLNGTLAKQAGLKAE